MNGRTRALLAGIAVAGAVFAVGLSLQAPPRSTPVVATFESTLDDEPVRRGAFEAGERVETPAGGRVVVNVPEGGQVTVRESSLARFESLAPLELELVRGVVEARAGDAGLTLRVEGRAVRVSPHAAVRVTQSPAALTVESGDVRVDGQLVTGHRDLGASR